MDIQKVSGYFEEAKDNFLEIISMEEYKKEIVFAAQHLIKQPKLSKNKAAFLREVYNAINLGFSLNPIMDYGNLIPVNKKGANGQWFTDIQFRPTYKGMIWAAREFCNVDIYAYCVFEGDEFTRSLGTSVEIHHVPMDKSNEIEKAYAVALLPNGQKLVEILSRDELNKIRDCSEGYKYSVSKGNNNSVWEVWEEEMSRKSAVKRLFKYLPKNTKFQKVVEADNQEYKIDPYGGFAEFLRSLINTSTYEESFKIQLERSLKDMTHFESQELLLDLKENQIDPMYKELGNNQGDILKAVDNAVKNDSK